MKITQEYKDARAYIKCAVALILHLRHPNWQARECMKAANEWLKVMETED